MCVYIHTCELFWAWVTITLITQTIDLHWLEEKTWLFKQKRKYTYSCVGEKYTNSCVGEVKKSDWLKDKIIFNFIIFILNWFSIFNNTDIQIFISTCNNKLIYLPGNPVLTSWQYQFYEKRKSPSPSKRLATSR